jgi:hypothetical protein
MGLYPRPKGASAPSTATWQKSFPHWKVRVDGLKPQQAMFQTAENHSFNAFYIAEDDWTQRWSNMGNWKKIWSFPQCNRICHLLPGDVPTLMFL